MQITFSVMHGLYLLRVSSLTLEINEFRCFEVKIEYIQWNVRVGGHPTVVAQWQSTGGSSPGVFGSTPSDCWPIQFFYFCLMAFTFINRSANFQDS